VASETFVSGGDTYKITLYPAPSDGKKYPVILLIHGNFGLGAPYGDQIHGFARNLAGHGYLVAVPQYYQDDEPHLADEVPHEQTLADAITATVACAGADPERLGLIGFSLGASTAMTFVTSMPVGTVKVLADFYGFLTPKILAAAANFPPTIIFHNDNDQVVKPRHSNDLDRTLSASKIEHDLILYTERQVIFHDGQLIEINHAFEPGGAADVDSRAKAMAWFVKYLAPTGK
jgi:dienelactone hydrolase